MKIIEKIKKHMQKAYDENFILTNLNRDPTNTNQKRVLISYIGIQTLNKLDSASHTQISEFGIILQYFILNGYAIDIFPFYSEKTEELQKNYDIAFGFGKPFRKVKNQGSSKFNILYLTENPPDISEKLEKERLDYFYERHGKKMPLERSGKCFINDDFENVNAIVYMCSREFVNSNSSYFLSPTGFKNNKFIPAYDNKSVKNFMWLGGFAVIHKGLDIIIDVFNKHSDWNLYVLGISQKELKKYGIKYKPNVHIMGFIDIQSETFIKIVEKVAFMLLPSCSEATPTAALTAMRHGVLPILCKNSGFDEKSKYVRFLNDYHIDYVESVIKKIINMTVEDYINESKAAIEYADYTFAAERYKRDLFKILDEIIKDEDKTNYCNVSNKCIYER